MTLNVALPEILTFEYRTWLANERSINLGLCTLHGASAGQKSKGTPKPGDELEKLKLQR